MSFADLAAFVAGGMLSGHDEHFAASVEIASCESSEEARTLTNALLRRCGVFLAPSGEFCPLEVAVIPGEGRCFYDVVLHQLSESGGAGLLAHADVLTLSMLEALSTCREQFEEFLAADEESQEAQRSQ